MADIVYLLKDGPNEELRYSLRSVERNFPADRIIFVGGKPDDITPDIFIKVDQSEPTKWANTRKNLLTAVQNDQISEDFWLFNDDFFIMRPYNTTEPEFDDSLWHHIAQIESRHRMNMSKYTLLLRHLCKTLRDAGIHEPKNYATHRPMLINRKKALETLQRFPSEPMFRALYGNINQIGGHEVKDCKVTPWLTPDYTNSDVVSTEDVCFAKGDVGRWIRSIFTEPSRWED